FSFPCFPPYLFKVQLFSGLPVFFLLDLPTVLFCRLSGSAVFLFLLSTSQFFLLLLSPAFLLLLPLPILLSAVQGFSGILPVIPRLFSLESPFIQSLIGFLDLLEFLGIILRMIHAEHSRIGTFDLSFGSSRADSQDLLGC